MHVVAMRVELHLPGARSLKAKRSLVRPVIDGCRNRFSVAAAEVDHQDLWQRAAVGVAVVSPSATLAGEMLDGVERFIWSFPEVEVGSCRRHWMEIEA